MKKLFLPLCAIFIVVTGIFVYNYQQHMRVSNASITFTATADQPTRLRIPMLHIDAAVLGVGATTTGQMDAPTSKAVNSPYWSSAFWYQRGAAPGEMGNAVIAGHVDRVGGDPALFWSLSSLKTGDTLSVLTQSQQEVRFSVDRVVRYPATAPTNEMLAAVFGPSSEHHLNLITCSGVWTGSGYDERLVVFTTQRA